MARQSAGKARHSLISRRLSTAERGLSSGGDTDMVRPSRGAPEGSMDPGRRMTTPAIIFPKLTKLSRLRSWRLLLVLLLAGTATLASAQERPRRAPAPQTEQHAETRQAEQRPAEARESVLRLLPADAVTEHTIDIPGGKLAYTATAGTLSLFDQSGERLAAIYYTAYVANNAEAANRPVTFAFNGGPGAASAYLNLGLVGPRILEFPGNDAATARLQDNPQTWLGFTDLVLIDPVGTGWSRPAKADNGSAFYGVRQDAQTLAKTIALYLGKNGRGNSPKYLLGESYGGFRAAKVAQALQRDQGIMVSGIVMVSPLIEGGLIFGGSRFALGAALQLPSLAAAELERKGTFSKEAQAEAERFAFTEYLTALAGPRPSGDAARNFYQRVAQITGLPEDKIVSRYDATFAVADPFPEQETARGPDPLLDGLTRAYGGAFANYARDELGFKSEMTYILLSPDISGKWDWGEGSGRGTASVTDDVRELLSLIPSFRLLVAHGYSDMVTPYAVSRYVLDHLPPIGDPSRTQLSLYRGGHMFYIDPESRKAFSADAKRFYQSTQ
jgi:carboxypeptidase C (cathepsin A)